MSEAWTDNPDLQAWFDSVRQDLVPKIANSSATVAIAPPDGKPDVKMAVELGFMILMDKPIVVVVAPGRPVPAKLRLVADAIVEGDLDDPGFRARFARVLNEVAG